MDWLEKTKRAANTNESITSEVAAQAYIENYALKLFVWADNMDRSGNFNKYETIEFSLRCCFRWCRLILTLNSNFNYRNVVKSFYTSGLLMDVLTVFGEQNEDIFSNRKYAKWKAAYIHNCLKNGETPVSGPVYSGTDEENELNDLMNVSNKPNIPAPGVSPTSNPSEPMNTNNTIGKRVAEQFTYSWVILSRLPVDGRLPQYHRLSAGGFYVQSYWANHILQ